jgi:putative Mg2+ transporter-C (MgtC) family protein
MISWQEALIRLLIALLFCGAVGIERYLSGKAAGVRTHILVGMGAAMFTLISGYAFGPTASNADRIAAQVVSGIGFIGGGAILKESGSIKGLTTAAGLWAVAALGMAAGAGLYSVGALGTIIILVTLTLLNRAEKYLPRRFVQTWSIQVTLADGASIELLRDAIETFCHRVTLDSLVSDGETRLTFHVEVRHALDIHLLTERLRAAGARSVTWQVQERGIADRGL